MFKDLTCLTVSDFYYFKYIELNSKSAAKVVQFMHTVLSI